MMRPEEKKTTTESIELYRESLAGNNYSPESIKAYLSDLSQFVGWLQTRRVDWDIPYRIARIDIVEFINHLATKKASAVTRKRKLAAIRGFLKFCKDNQLIYGNPADTIEGPIREERDPAILLKTEYKALLQVAGGNTRDLAIVMLFLQTGLRGVLLLRQPGTPQAEAEACFQRALDVARRQEAKSLELRAAMSLSRLWQQQGKRTEARELLAPIYGWFTEGFDTADLQEARALLEALA
jgi:integrase